MKRTGRGGVRLGAGRPPGPPELARRNRVVVMLTDAELDKLRRLAKDRKLPLGTVAYGYVERGLRRAETRRGKR